VYGEVKLLALTEVQIKQALPREKRYMIRDDRGLYLEVMPGGSKFWRLRYWEEEKEHKISLGEYPLISLRQAREERDKIRVDRLRGVSPRAPKENKVTFEAAALEWHEKQIRPRAKPYAEKVLSILQRLVLPSIGNRDIRELTAPELLIPLRNMEARGILDTAHTALQILGQIYRYAIATGYTDRNIAADLRGALAPVISKHRASITAPKEIGGLLRAIEAYHGSIVVKAGLHAHKSGGR
jgi:hypothetical protein